MARREFLRTDLMQPWVIGYRRHPFTRDFFKFIDVDAALQPAAR